MHFARSIIKVCLGLAVFASLMFLEFNSYTRAIAEGVDKGPVLISKKTAPNATVGTVKKVIRLKN